MFRILDRGHERTCQGTSRREFLKIGGLGLGGLTLANLLQTRAQGAAADSFLRDKAVVLLFLSGGPPHIEFFDPKMTAPAEIRCTTGEVQTKIPGITFGATFPKLASLTDKIAIVRSYGSKSAEHTYGHVSSGDNPTKAAMSAIYGRIAGTNNSRTGIPSNVLVKPEAIQAGLKLDSNFETGALPTLTDAGTLGKTFAAFDPSGGGTLQQDMQLTLAADRLTSRRSLLRSLDQQRTKIDRSGAIEAADKYQQQAYEVITRGIGTAFDWAKEDPRTIEKYSTKEIFNAPDLQRWGDMRRVTNLLGHQMLLARRLCEAGCGFVTVSDCGWDYHANGNSPKQMAGIYPMGHQVDHAISAFVEDLHERGLQDKILLLVTGEMGRTPRLNKDGGRDHYGDLSTLLIAGGGLKMGQVIGQSDRTASRPATDPYDPRHLLGTVMNTVFDVGKLRIDPTVPADLARIITGSEKIEPLFE
ncbi:MAG TPA: DUF1501 domain-containing protein [Pirellulales bacterium]|jgi:hypothetical protein|nr:DUF1501 domain-containing protein [Pirellulales bacterium]